MIASQTETSVDPADGRRETKRQNKRTSILFLFSPTLAVLRIEPPGLAMPGHFSAASS